MTIQAAKMTEQEFKKVYARYEAIHGRDSSELDADRSWNRYKKIVL